MEDWYLKFDNAMLGSNDTDLGEGLMLYYNISAGKSEDQFISTVYEADCMVQSNDTTIYINGTSIESDNLQEKGIVSVHFNMSTLQASELWSNVTNSLNFCVRTELFLNGISVVFVDTKVKTAIDFSAGFVSYQIDEILLQKQNATKYENYETFELSACVCEEKVCDYASVLQQNSKFMICVFLSTDDIVISRFEEVVFYQDGIAKFIPVKDGILTSITTATGGPIGILETRAVSSFFVDSDPTDLRIEGQVLVDFKSSTRRLYEEVSLVKKFSKSKSSVTFDIEIKLKTSDSKRYFQNIGLMSTLLLVLVVKKARKKRKNSYKSVSLVDPLI